MQDGKALVWHKETTMKRASLKLPDLAFKPWSTRPSTRFRGTPRAIESYNFRDETADITWAGMCARRGEDANTATPRDTDNMDLSQSVCHQLSDGQFILLTGSSIYNFLCDRTLIPVEHLMQLGYDSDTLKLENVHIKNQEFKRVVGELNEIYHREVEEAASSSLSPAPLRAPRAKASPKKKKFIHRGASAKDKEAKRLVTRKARPSTRVPNTFANKAAVCGLAGNAMVLADLALVVYSALLAIVADIFRYPPESIEEVRQRVRASGADSHSRTFISIPIDDAEMDEVVAKDRRLRVLDDDLDP